MNNNTINFDETMPPGGKDPGDSSLKPGDVLGQYKVVRLLGRGGMGEVYEVEHTTLLRKYALKLLPADFANRADALERFRREARAMANIEHPNIVQVDDFGETDGRYWLRMELATGAEGGDPKSEVGDQRAEVGGRRSEVRTLGEYADAQGGRLDPNEAAAVFAQVLDGLAHAHQHGMIHRDLKPANILICTDGDGEATFKIADFGLVRLVGEEWVRSQAEVSVKMSMSVGGMPTELPEGAGTSTKSMLGTFEYMSPEQKRGEKATAASDVYAVGMMIFRLLTGKSQPGFKPPSKLVDGLDPAWDDVILTALEEDAADRFANAAAMRECLPGEPSTASAASFVQQEPQPDQPEPNRADTPTASDAASPADDPTAGNELGMEFVRVEPGSFLMGSDQAEAFDDEKPVHEVTLTQPFWIGKYPVTQAEYEKLTGNNPSGFQDEEVIKNGFLGIGREIRPVTRPGLPVESVSSHDADNFCKALTERERRAGHLPDGYVYRLPTEAEWEYAARGGTKSRGLKYSGSNNAAAVAWHSGNSRGKTHEVGQKKPNELGLHDMSGNVWEWCYDWYDDDFYGKSPGTNPVNTAAASYRVERGGCWVESSRYVRLADRGRKWPKDSSGILGLRVCLAPAVRG